MSVEIPVRWEFNVDGVRVTNISTDQLLDWRAIRQIIAERLTRIVPLIKNQEWERILQPLMSAVRIIDTPDEASIAGSIRAKLREFAAKADLTSPGESQDERKALLRGLPIVQVIDGERCIVWRGQDFTAFLKRTKSEELKGVNLWFAIKEMGVRSNKIRIPGVKENSSINICHMPVKMVLKDEATAPEYRSDL
jgi:hypothetical protein